MVIAMLTLPAGTAGYAARNLAGMMGLGCLFSAIFSSGGLAAGWAFDLPVGAMVVVIAGAVFLGVAAFRLIWSRLSSGRPERRIP
jgi:zinc transport system permease protein